MSYSKRMLTFYMSYFHNYKIVRHSPLYEMSPVSVARRNKFVKLSTHVPSICYNTVTVNKEGFLVLSQQRREIVCSTQMQHGSIFFCISVADKLLRLMYCNGSGGKWKHFSCIRVKSLALYIIIYTWQNWRQ